MRKPPSNPVRRVVREEARTWTWILVLLVIYGVVKWLL